MEPTPDDVRRLAEQRAVCERFLGDDASWARYKTPAGKLGLIRALLEQNVFRAEQTYELQCLGIVFGDAFVAELGFVWIIVEDEYGRDPAVQLPGTSIILYPLTMISKRVEAGQQVDVFELFNTIAADVLLLQTSGN